VRIKYVVRRHSKDVPVIHGDANGISADRRPARAADAMGLLSDPGRVEAGCKQRLNSLQERR